jgi:hypothetical protein
LISLIFGEYLCVGHCACHLICDSLSQFQVSLFISVCIEILLADDIDGSIIGDHWGCKNGSYASSKTRSRSRKQFYALFDVINAHGASSSLDCVCLLIQHDAPPHLFSPYTTFDHISEK